MASVILDDSAHFDQSNEYAPYHDVESSEPPSPVSEHEKVLYRPPRSPTSMLSLGLSRLARLSRRRFYSLSAITLLLFLTVTFVNKNNVSHAIPKRTEAFAKGQQRLSTILGFNPPLPIRTPKAEIVVPSLPPEPAAPEFMKTEKYLKGPPTLHFQDNLVEDAKYLTSWMGAGFTNDVMTMGNIIYLAKITNRVPVLPPLTSHIEGGAPPLPLSEVFDMDYLMRATGVPILEWHQVKDFNNYSIFGSSDELGCWATWEAVGDHDGPRSSYTPVQLNLDISYTRTPKWVKLNNLEWDMSVSYWSLAKLDWPQARQEALAAPWETPTRANSKGATIPPDDQMLCFDYLYFAGVAEAAPEYEWDFSPAWHDVVTHMQWTPHMTALARRYARRAFGVAPGAPLPAYITIHVRHGDFAGICGEKTVGECWAPVSAYERRVKEVQDEIRKKRGVVVSHVIMTSDEKDEGWWVEVRERGWYRVDHTKERTVEQLGTWYPVIIDAVIQSGGLGFVGTQFSTFSILARRRVEEWNNGAVRTVRWGWVGADEPH